MEIQLKKGLLEAYVLSLLGYQNYYGYNLLQTISQTMEVSESTLYPILRRLEEKQFLKTYSKEYNGRIRKYYEITIEGIKRLEEYKIMCAEVQSVIYKILGGN